MRQSHELVKIISTVPLFSAVDEEGLDQIAQAAQLVVANQGRVIIKQGDIDRSMYVVLRGKVRVLTYDNQGKEMELAILSKNDFFGEISLLQGVPRTATVQAVEKTLLCQLSFEAMRKVLMRLPDIKATLEQYRVDRLKDGEAKTTEAGFVERRKHTRYRLRLPVGFSVSPTVRVSDEFLGKKYHTFCTYVSFSGMLLEIEDSSLRGLPKDCQLQLEIALPPPWGPVRCLGALRHVLENKDQKDLWYLGVEFSEITPAEQEKFRKFLFG